MVGELRGARVFVAGHGGLAGDAIRRALDASGARTVTATRAQLDLTDADAVGRWMTAQRPDAVVLAAARVGGIGANRNRPVEFLSENVLIQTHVMDAAHAAGVDRMLFVASSCAYPREAVQPMREEAMFTGPPEPTNASYAIAKAAGMQLARAYRQQYGRAFRSVIACNLYGAHGPCVEDEAHVIPALMQRMAAAARTGAPEVAVWGTGRPLREFLHADDLARAVVDLLGAPPEEDWINVGSGEEIAIAELAARIAEVAGFRGRIRFDTSRPDGAPRKLLDCTRMRARGWRPRVGLIPGLRASYAAMAQADLTVRRRRAA